MDILNKYIHKYREKLNNDYVIDLEHAHGLARHELFDIDVEEFRRFAFSCVNENDFVAKDTYVKSIYWSYTNCTRLMVLFYNFIHYGVLLDRNRRKSSISSLSLSTLTLQEKIKHFDVHMCYKLTILSNISSWGGCTVIQTPIDNKCIVCLQPVDKVCGLVVCWDCVYECTGFRKIIVIPIIPCGYNNKYMTICRSNKTIKILFDDVVKHSHKLIHRYYGVNVTNIILFMMIHTVNPPTYLLETLLPKDVIWTIIGFIYQ